MCYPMIFMAVAAVATAAITIQQGQQQKKMYKAQQEQVQQEAAYRLDAGKAQAEKIRRISASQRGEATAALAASGVKLGEGSALEIDKTIATRGEEDALSAILSGERGYRSGMAESDMLGMAGSNAEKSANMNAAGSLLSTGANYYSGWRGVASGRSNYAVS